MLERNAAAGKDFKYWQDRYTASGAEGKGGMAPAPVDWSKVPPIPEANAGRLNHDYVPPGTAGAPTMGVPKATRGLSNVGRNALIGVILAGLLTGVIFAFTGIGGSGPSATATPAIAPSSAATGAPLETTVASSPPASTSGVDLSKLQWRMFTEAQRNSDGTGACRYLVTGHVDLFAPTQELLDAVLGKTAVVSMSGPGLPAQIEVPITVNGGNYGEFGIVTKATAGATYQATLVAVGGIDLGIAGDTFTNPCK